MSKKYVIKIYVQPTNGFTSEEPVESEVFEVQWSSDTDIAPRVREMIVQQHLGECAPIIKVDNGKMTWRG